MRLFAIPGAVAAELSHDRHKIRVSFYRTGVLGELGVENFLLRHKDGVVETTRLWYGPCSRTFPGSTMTHRCHLEEFYFAERLYVGLSYVLSCKRSK